MSDKLDRIKGLAAQLSKGSAEHIRTYPHGVNGLAVTNLSRLRIVLECKGPEMSAEDAMLDVLEGALRRQAVASAHSQAENT